MMEIDILVSRNYSNGNTTCEDDLSNDMQYICSSEIVFVIPNIQIQIIILENKTSMTHVDIFIAFVKVKFQKQKIISCQRKKLTRKHTQKA